MNLTQSSENMYVQRPVKQNYTAPPAHKIHLLLGWDSLIYYSSSYKWLLLWNYDYMVSFTSILLYPCFVQRQKQNVLTWNWKLSHLPKCMLKWHNISPQLSGWKSVYWHSKLQSVSFYRDTLFVSNWNQHIFLHTSHHFIINFVSNPFYPISLWH